MTQTLGTQDFLQLTSINQVSQVVNVSLLVANARKTILDANDINTADGSIKIDFLGIVVDTLRTSALAKVYIPADNSPSSVIDAAIPVITTQIWGWGVMTPLITKENAIYLSGEECLCVSIVDQSGTTLAGNVFVTYSRLLST